MKAKLHARMAPFAPNTACGRDVALVRATLGTVITKDVTCKVCLVVLSADKKGE